VFDQFKAVAAAKKGKLVFVTVDASGASKDPVMNFFGVKEADVPAVGGPAQHSPRGTLVQPLIVTGPCAGPGPRRREPPELRPPPCAGGRL
jgi:hypothetical protein